MARNGPPKMRCEACDCSFSSTSFQQHQRGKRHLQNVALNGHPAPGAPLQPSPSHSAWSNPQPVPPQATTPSSVGNPPIPGADPRVTVTHEDGLDFIAEGTGSAAHPAFSSINHTVSIKTTNVNSFLSVESVTLSPPSGSCFTASLVGELSVIRFYQPREVLVSFQASRVGTFHATLNITFSDTLGPNREEFTVTRELRGRASLSDNPTSDRGAPNTEEVAAGSEGTGITVSHDFGLEFSVESAQSDGSFGTHTKELIITKSSPIPRVTIEAARVHPIGDSVTEPFSAQLEGDSKVIRPNRRFIVAVSYTPRQEGLCEATVELIFHDHGRNVDFVVNRTISGWAKGRTDGHVRRQNGSESARRSQPVDNWGDDHASVSSDEEEEFLDSHETGISVSDEDGLDFDIVERKRANGPFATASASLTIKLAEGFPSVTFLNERIKTLDGSDSGFVATFDGDSHTIRPGTESTVRIMFNPKFDGLFKATLELVFYDGQRSARFVVRRSLLGIAGSIEDHKHFESLDQDEDKESTKEPGYVPPQRVIRLLQPVGRHKSRKFPEYEVPPLVREAVEKSTVNRPYDKNASDLIAELRPNELTMDTYAQYFTALLNVEDGHQQWDILNQPFYVVEVQQNGNRNSIEIENHDEDLLPEVILGDYLWMDDIQEDIRYEARITKADVFSRNQGRAAVLKMSLKLPSDFYLYRGVQFILRFRLNRITLRRQYHALANSSTSLRRLLFPSVADIKPMKYMSRAEIDNLDLVNKNIRHDDQQLQTVVSILRQPKGSVPFIIFGPPGTGKTTTVVESIIQLVRRDPTVRVLACTPSNAAADLLVERLAGAGLDSDQLYRLNAYSREEESVPEDVQQFSVIPKFAKLRGFRVVLSTCSSAGMLQTWNVPFGHFSHIVIDEAAQAEEPLVMIPIVAFSNANTNIILAGDPNQLGPVNKSPTAGARGLGKSYLRRLMFMRDIYGLDTQSSKTIVGLQRNRRSHGAIIAWPNRYFYEDIMRAHGDKDTTHLLLQSRFLPKKGFPVIFHGIKGSEKRTRMSPSYFNIMEASVVRNYCVMLLAEGPEQRIYPEEIGVMAPYRAQVRTIRELLKQSNLSGISVGSVEQFQGQERKVIIMATTRSNEEYHPRRAMGFLTNRRRLNVAITRAQSLLIMVGDPEVLGKDPLWRTFLNYIRLRGGSTGKEPSWKAEETVLPRGYEIVPRREDVVYGEEFIDGKSRELYRYILND